MNIRIRSINNIATQIGCRSDFSREHPQVATKVAPT